VLIIATGSTASLNVILNLLLIPPYGMNGAAVATSIGYGSMAVTYVYAARVIGFDPTNELKLARIAASSLVTLVVLLALDSLVAGRILSLAVLPVIGGIVYSGLIFQTRVVTIKEANQALDELPDPISVFGKRIVGVRTDPPVIKTLSVVYTANVGQPSAGFPLVTSCNRFWSAGPSHLPFRP